MSKNLISIIRKQKELSDGLVVALLPIMRANYYPHHTLDEIICGDMGSFARGTNNDVSPDLDIGFFGVPLHQASDHKDWTPIGTRELTGKKEGITSLAELDQYDAVAVRAIQHTLPAIEAYFRIPPRSTQFNYMRTWTGYPGWVSNLALPHPEFGTIEFDLNICYEPSHYGMEHTRRFNQYFNQVIVEFGDKAAIQLIEDIRLLKNQGKANARDSSGWIDRNKKLAGFVVESLFMHQYPPHTYAEVMQLVLAHQWEPGIAPTQHWLGDQNDQLIDAGFTFSEVLKNLACDNEALPLGAWENLLSIAQAAG